MASRESNLDVIEKYVRARRASIEEKRSTFGKQLSASCTQRSGNIISASPQDAREDTTGNRTSAEPDRNFSAPPTPPLAEFGKAYSFNFQTAHSNEEFKRSKSCDQRSPTGSRFSFDSGDHPHVTQSTSENCLRSSGLSHEARGSYDRFEGSSELEILPCTTFVRPEQTRTNSSPKAKATTATVPRIMADCGTDAGNPCMWKSTTATQKATNAKDTASFEPAFAIVEDLIIYFTSGTENEILQSVVQSYKNSRYPMIPSQEPEVLLSLESPTSPSNYSTNLSPTSHFPAETDGDSYDGRRGLGPYCLPGRRYGRHFWPSR